MQRKGDSRISLVALFSLAFVLAFSHIQGFLHPFSFQYFTLNFSSIPSLNFTNFSCFWVYLLLTSNMYYYIFLKLCRIFYMILGCYIPLPYLHTLYSDIFNNKYFVIYKFIITIHFFFSECTIRNPTNALWRMSLTRYWLSYVRHSSSNRKLYVN